MHRHRIPTSFTSGLRTNHPAFGVAGSGVIAAGMMVSAALYRGAQGERYSILNHFVSELGHVGVAQAAPVFNAGLILGGLLLLPFIIGLALSLNSRCSKLAMVAGIIAAVSATLVGLFPMNVLRPHIVAAMTYFRFGLLTIVLYGVAISRQPHGSEVVDRRVNWIGALAGLAYASFLGYMGFSRAGPSQFDPSTLSFRPTVFLPALMEWAVLISTLVWFVTVALGRPTGLARPVAGEGSAGFGNHDSRR